VYEVYEREKERRRRKIAPSSTYIKVTDLLLVQHLVVALLLAQEN